MALCGIGHITTTSVAPAELQYPDSFTDVDSNADSTVSLSEFQFGPGSRLRFYALDVNEDGVLTLAEWKVREQSISVPALRLFRGYDADGNGKISKDELLSSIPADIRHEANRSLIVFDFDQDGSLSYEEYLAIPSMVAESERGDVPDPIVNRAQKDLSLALESFHLNRETPRLLHREDWLTAAFGQWYAPYFNEFDRDGDGAVSAEEVRAGFELMFGLQYGNGVTLRRDSGYVFNWNTFLAVWDIDGDLKLSGEEFIPRFWRGPDEAQRLFKISDLNNDGLLTPDELEATPFVWVDIVSRFLALDKTLDGVLEPEELEQGLASWERPYFNQIWQKYDTDADSRLTFAEFRASPLANPVLDWRRQPIDQDGDGLLSLAEFHPVKGIQFLGISKVFFDLCDRDANALLDSSEFDFDIDFGRVPTQVVYRAMDKNRDERLTLQEAGDSLVRPDSSFELIQPFLHLPFQENDQNGDGVLDAEEFALATSLRRAIQRVDWGLRNSRPKFLRRNRNNDDFVDRDEWLADRPHNELSEAEYEFVLCDFDADGRLSFNEFSCVPSVAPSFRRGNVPDPIAELVDNLLATMAENDPNVISTTITKQFAGAAPLNIVQDWDFDKDGQLADREIRRGIEILFGVRHSDGTRLRRATGQVFELRTFNAYDRDGDGMLSKSEFVERYWGGEIKAEEIFGAVNKNGDNVLSVQEAAEGDLFWSDCLSQFRRFDIDQNGKVNSAELAKVAKSWETAYAEMAFPGFDAGKTGALSFGDFRETPFGNPLADWNRRRSDSDQDGYVSLDDFHDSQSWALRGLSSMIFSRLDLDSDHRLSLHELNFSIDFRRVPLEILFTALDADRNGALALAEVVGKTSVTDNPIALKKRNERLMQIEDAFRAADLDQNNLLSLGEFVRPGLHISELLAGRNPSKANSYRKRDSAPVGDIQKSKSFFAARNWRVITVVLFDAMLLIGLVWGGLRWASR